MRTQPLTIPIERDTLADWLERLCRHDTTTGREDDGLAELSDLIVELDGRVELQPVQERRTNVLALWGRPRVLFTTHLDTVPPFIPPVIADGAVHGRGTCDAKGQIVAQLAAIATLNLEGERDVAWLGVVGEETDSPGADKALELRDRLTDCEVVIDGEPTRCRLATGQRGVEHYRLVTQGRSVHSASPDPGYNAILAMLDWVQELRGLEPLRDDRLGAESWNLAVLQGGGAANVVPDRAEAEILARTVPGSRFGEELDRTAPQGARFDVLHASKPALFPQIDGFEHAPVPFGSDAPNLRGLAPDGAVVLAGPGRIEVAHGSSEHITLQELADGVELNLRLARHFLEEGQ